LAKRSGKAAGPSTPTARRARWGPVRADTARGQARPVGLPSEGGEQHDLVAQAGAGGEQRGERAGGGALIGAAEGGDDVLPVGTVFAAVRDDLQVAAGPGRA
jgi:hypothetical protein